MTNNSNKTDTHIYNIINNPPKEFTEPCVACGVSEFQLGVRHAEERIIKELETHAEKELARLRSPSTHIVSEENYAYYEGILEAVSVIKGEQK